MFCHIDADSFFASVLVRKHPHLRGKPLLAMGMGGGCVISASYEAKKFGVKTGMRLSEARKLAPHALAMPSDFAETGIASDQIEEIIRTYGPHVEEMSVDEWFLDIASITGGIPKDLAGWAENIRREIVSRTAISVSVGIGPTKLLAKMASEYKKPAGRTVITMEGGKLDEVTIGLRAFLADRPAAAIPGIGRQRLQHTDAHGWTTALHIADAPEHLLKKLFGSPGSDLKKELLGQVVYKITVDPAPPKSLSRARSFLPTSDESILRAHGIRHMEYLLLKLRRHGLMARGMSFWLRDRTYTQYQGTQRAFPSPANTQTAIFPIFTGAFNELYKPNCAYTQVGLTLFSLVPEGASQLSLLDAPGAFEGAEALQASLDALQTRFGRNAIPAQLLCRYGAEHRSIWNSPCPGAVRLICGNWRRSESEERKDVEEIEARKDIAL